MRCSQPTCARAARGSTSRPTRRAWCGACTPISPGAASPCSMRRRGFCPSCGARRMAETAAYLVDRVIPRVPVRQWVLSFPIPLRILLAAHPDLLTPVLSIVHRVITGFLLSQSGLKRTAADAGSVTLIQRFGSAANLNVHLHCLVLDGVYRRTEGEPVFDAVRSPTGDELAGLLDQIVARLMKLLTRRGYLVEEQGMTYLADTDADHPLTSLQAASCTYRIALGPRAGQKVLVSHSNFGSSRDPRRAAPRLHGLQVVGALPVPEPAARGPDRGPRALRHDRASRALS
ncbi:MAG: transposase [Burkholderiales bacterium]|nr:transposase [Burkholderiales bacterium]